MFRSVRTFLKTRKKWILTFLLFTLAFLILRLPWTEIADKAVRKVTAPLPVNIHFRKTAIHILPPALSLHQVSISNRTLAAPLELDQIRLAPAWLKWLAFSKGLKIHFLKDGTRFSLVTSFKKITENKLKKNKLQIEGNSSQLHLSFLQSLLPSVSVSGHLSLQFEIEGPMENLLNGKGFIQIQGRNIKLKQILLETDLGPLHLPDIQWKEAQIIARLSEEQVVLEKFLLGKDTDPFFLQMRGDMELRFNRSHVRLGKYDLQLSAQIDRDFKLSIIDLLLLNTKTPTQKGWQYLARIIGNGTRVPDIEKISEF